MAIKTVVSNLLSHYGFLSTEMIGAIDKETDADNKAQYQEEIDLHANAQEVDFEDVDEETGEVTNENKDTDQDADQTAAPGF